MPDRVQDLTNHRKVATACKNYTDQEIAKCEERMKWYMGETTVSTSDDNTTAYRKTVPANATRAKIKRIYGNSVKYSPASAGDNTTALTKTIPSYNPSIDRASASMNILGGMSYKVNQLLNKNSFMSTHTINGITFTNNEDGSITVNGTAEAQVTENVLWTSGYQSGHKYLLKGCPANGATNKYYMFLAGGGANDIGDGAIFERTAGANLQIHIENGTTVSNLKFIPQMFDLTADFGSGNEPATVEAAAAAYLPRGIDIYSYTPQQSTIRDTAVTNISSSNNLFDMSNAVSVSLKNTTLVETTSDKITFNVENTSDPYAYISSSYQVKKGYTYTVYVKSTSSLQFYALKYGRMTTNPSFYQNYNNDTLNYTFTATETNYLTIGLEYQPNVAQHNISTQVMLVYGTTAPTEFKPYFSANLAIPAQVQALDGYGWGISDTLYNYVDFNSKKFIKKVGRVDLGTLNYTYVSSNNRSLFQTTISTIKGHINTNTAIICLSTIYKPVTYNTIWTDKDISYGIITRGSKIITMVNNAYNDATAFKTAMSGVYLYYELETPVETDISTYLTTNSIDIEPGGTLTAENTNNAYIPSNVSYNGVIKHAMVTAVKKDAFNIWDEECKNGTSIDTDTGQEITSAGTTGYSISKNPISILPNTEYYATSLNSKQVVFYYYDINNNYLGFVVATNSSKTTPNNARWLKIRISENPYDNDICINISGTLNGTYKPHKPSITRNLGNNEAKYSWGITTGVRNVRDYTTNKGNLAVNSTDLGVRSWSMENDKYFISSLADAKLPSSTSVAFNGICEIYDAIGITPLSPSTDMKMALSSTKTLFIRNSIFNNDTIFRNAMSGIMLFYEENTTDTENITAIDNIIEVEGGDTLTFINTEGLPVPSDITYRIEVAN